MKKKASSLSTRGHTTKKMIGKLLNILMKMFLWIER